MSTLVPPWVWLVVAALLAGGGFAYGYHKGSVRWQVKLEVERAAWAAREAAYATNANTAAANLQAAREALKAHQNASAALIQAAQDEAVRRERAASTWRAEAERWRRRAESLPPLPATCEDAVLQLALDVARVGGP